MTEAANELGRLLSAVVMTAIAILILDWRPALFVLFIVPGTVLISNRVARSRNCAGAAMTVRTAAYTGL
ncbi:hypothetical protein [Shumkonia mesophila]|uniref:hypothetical protein n=1 Tax=Shumkonia mesophila TaxID=2838854 RepID=UPI0029342103|nr:hypothetical protein [Shumkonia mesophila]